MDSVFSNPFILSNFEWRNGKRTLESCIPILYREYKINTTVKAVQKALREAGILDGQNMPLPPYDDNVLFDFNVQTINSPYGRRVGYNYKLFLSKAGLEFLGKFLIEKEEEKKRSKRNVSKQKPNTIK